MVVPREDATPTAALRLVERWLTEVQQRSHFLAALRHERAWPCPGLDRVPRALTLFRSKPAGVAEPMLVADRAGAQSRANLFAGRNCIEHFFLSVSFLLKLPASWIIVLHLFGARTKLESQFRLSFTVIEGPKKCSDFFSECC